MHVLGICNQICCYKSMFMCFVFFPLKLKLKPAQISVLEWHFSFTNSNTERKALPLHRKKATTDIIQLQSLAAVIVQRNREARRWG